MTDRPKASSITTPSKPSPDAMVNNFGNNITNIKIEKSSSLIEEGRFSYDILITFEEAVPVFEYQINIMDENGTESILQYKQYQETSVTSIHSIITDNNVFGNLTSGVHSFHVEVTNYSTSQIISSAKTLITFENNPSSSKD